MTITLTHEEAQQVLDALEGVKDMAWDSDTVTGRKLIETLRAKLSEPEPQPVAWRKLWEGETEYTYYWSCRYKGSEPLYTTPPPQRKECQRCGEVNPAEIHTCTPQREWQGLTDEERNYLAWESSNGEHCVAMTEAKLKGKNYDKR
jgi:hypothetical protein